MVWGIRKYKAFIDIRLCPSIATPPEVDQATAMGDLHTKFREDRSSGSRDRPMLADRHTQKETDRQTDLSTLIALHRSPTAAE